jgi:LPXTG-motif cell wall-anchored protein
VANDRTNVVYRFTATNCGLEPLNGVTITTGISGTPTVTIGDLAVGASSTATTVNAAKDQLLTAATVTGKGITSGTEVNAADPAQAVFAPTVLPNVLPTPLPATGSRSTSQLWVAVGLMLAGLWAVRISRHRKTF